MSHENCPGMWKYCETCEKARLLREHEKGECSQWCRWCCEQWEIEKYQAEQRWFELQWSNHVATLNDTIDKRYRVHWYHEASTTGYHTQVFYTDNAERAWKYARRAAQVSRSMAYIYDDKDRWVRVDVTPEGAVDYVSSV